MRTLLYVPVVHALCETGARGPRYVRAVEMLLGSQEAARHLQALEELWRILPDTVIENVEASGISWSGVHLFADSLPLALGGNPDAFVPAWMMQFLAAGSPMAMLLADMIQRGATLHGTEDDVLVQQHSAHLLMGEHGADDRLAGSRRYTALRDACIAMHVNQAVPDGDAAVVIMGAAHRVDIILESEPSWRVERIDMIDLNLGQLLHPLS